MHRVILALALLLAACSAPAPKVQGFRDPAAPIYSSAAFAPGDLAGSWRQVAAFGPAGRCVAGQASFTPDAEGGLRLAAELCLNGRKTRLSGPVAVTGPGRFRLPGLGEAWLIWADADRRTLAFATPSGAWGFVLDRGDIPADRLAAAAEIFAFNGYLPGSLNPF